MPEHVALPYPSEVVSTDFTHVLKIVYGSSNRGNGTCKRLLEARKPVDAAEAHHTRVENEV